MNYIKKKINKNNYLKFNNFSVKLIIIKNMRLYYIYNITNIINSYNY